MSCARSHSCEIKIEARLVLIESVHQGAPPLLADDHLALPRLVS